MMVFKEFAKLYCETQEQTPENLKKILMDQYERFSNDGWMLLECHQLDSSKIGSRTILPYGPKNTYKSVPTTPISPRGLASDMSVVIATMDYFGLLGHDFTGSDHCLKCHTEMYEGSDCYRECEKQ